MKIVKHCRECLPELVTGQLLGLDIDGRLEVTDCFPFPSRGDEEDDEDGASYQVIALSLCLSPSVYACACVAGSHPLSPSLSVRVMDMCAGGCGR